MGKTKWFCPVVLVSLAVIYATCKELPVKAPVQVIFDTDIAPDYDDVGALAVLHALADSGEANILATISSNSYKTTAPVLSIINTYFDRTGMPVGVLKAPAPSYDCPRKWADTIISKYPHNIKSNDAAMDAVKLYRKILSSQPDTSVTIITVGYLTNLSNLLVSGPDGYSPLDGKELIKKKVKQLVSMAGAMDSTGQGGYESNILADIPAARRVFAEWPTEIILSGHEIGAMISTGMKLIANQAIQNSPVKEAYKVAIAYDGTVTGRFSWDQTAVLAGIRGMTPYFNFRKIDMRIREDGKNEVIDGDRIKYLLTNQRTSELAGIIEELMMHVPVRDKKQK